MTQVQGVDFTHTTISMTAHARLKRFATRNGRNMQDVLNELIHKNLPAIRKSRKG